MKYIKDKKTESLPEEYHGIYDRLNQMGIVRDCTLTPRGRAMLNMEERARSPIKGFIHTALMPFI